MGCTHSAKQYNSSSKHSQGRSQKKAQQNTLEHSFDVNAKKYNPDLMKAGHFAAPDTHDDSLCPIEAKRYGHFNDLPEQNDVLDNSFKINMDNDSQMPAATTDASPNITSAKVQGSVVPAIMEPNWLLSHNIANSSLLQRRMIVVTKRSSDIPSEVLAL